MPKKKISKRVAEFFNNPSELVTGGDEKVIALFKTFLLVRMAEGNSGEAYGIALLKFFDWCCEKRLSIKGIEHRDILIYQQSLDDQFSAAYVNLQLSAIRTLFDWLMKKGCIPANPAVSVRSDGKVDRPSSFALTSEQASLLLDSIDVSSLEGLRNRAMLGAMMHGFIGVSELAGMRRDDYVWREDRWWFNLGKGKFFRQIPANSELATYMEEYLTAIGVVELTAPLFIILTNKVPNLRGSSMTVRNVQRIVERCANNAKIEGHVTPRSLRATGLRNFLLGGGRLEKAQQIVGHSKVSTTSAYLERQDLQVIYEGDLDGLVDLLRETENSPLQAFIKKSGIFRVTLDSSELIG